MWPTERLRDPSDRSPSKTGWLIPIKKEIDNDRDEARDSPRPEQPTNVSTSYTTFFD
jgi:hypothetical protein